MIEQQSINFKALFGNAGEYGSFNDFKRSNQGVENINSPPEDGQIKNEDGPAGITLYSRRGRVRLTELGPAREPGCSAVDGFFDNSSRADEVLF